MNIIRKPAKVWYLEIQKPQIDYHPLNDFESRKQFPVDLEQYLEVYKEVGDPWDWANRLIMNKTELQKLLADSKNEIYYCFYKDAFAGYFELDTHQEEIEIVYFGLSPRFIGKGLGKQMMLEALNIAHQRKSPRIWLHTCEIDSPQALAFYQKSGFVVFDEKIEEQVIIE